jgi:DNA-binding Lrp family transcriptional regulator
MRMSAGWTFLSNHGHLLVAVATDPSLRIRDLADRVGITERAAQLILNDLVEGGYLLRTRVGRRNEYEVVRDRPFRHPAEAGHTIDELLALFAPADG